MTARTVHAGFSRPSIRRYGSSVQRAMAHPACRSPPLPLSRCLFPSQRHLLFCGNGALNRPPFRRPYMAKVGTDASLPPFASTSRSSAPPRTFESADPPSNNKSKASNTQKSSIYARFGPVSPDGRGANPGRVPSAHRRSKCEPGLPLRTGSRTRNGFGAPGPWYVARRPTSTYGRDWPSTALVMDGRPEVVNAAPR
jgi:hypothetical protein